MTQNERHPEGARSIRYKVHLEEKHWQLSCGWLVAFLPAYLSSRDIFPPWKSRRQTSQFLGSSVVEINKVSLLLQRNNSDWCQ